MTAFVFRRILLAVPTVFIVFIICFFLSEAMPGDDVETFNGNNTEGYANRDGDSKLYEENYKRTVIKLGLNKPPFYWSLLTKSYPDTLNNILFLPQKKLARQYLERCGNWPLVESYFKEIDEIKLLLSDIPDSILSNKSTIESELFKLKYDKDTQVYTDLNLKNSDNPAIINLNSKLIALNEKQVKIFTSKPEVSSFTPKLLWNGKENRFHYWMLGIFSINKNVSLLDSRPVWSKIASALKWTLSINIIAILISVIISIQLGKYLALKSNTLKVRILNSFLFSVYTIPTFWIGSLLLIFFTNSEYGSWMRLFPAGGVGDVNSGTGFFNTILIRLHHFILPVICLSYPSIAYLSSHLRDGLSDASKEDWFKTALSKGLPLNTVLNKHGLKNAIFPLISLLGQIIPSIIGGSIIIEVLFNIPGMGRLMFTSVLSHDWPIVFNIVIITGMIVVFSQILVDVLYRLLDPRISSTN